MTVEDIIEYDLDSKPVAQTSYAGFSERFIHAQIYRARGDVKAVVHHHAPEVVSFSVSGVPLRAVAHMAAFLGDGTSVFDTRPLPKNGDMLVGNDQVGAALAKAMGDRPAILLRGHGAVVVAEGLEYHPIGRPVARPAAGAERAMIYKCRKERTDRHSVIIGEAGLSCYDFAC